MKLVFKKNVLFRKLELEERLRREAEEFEKRRKEEEEASRLLLVCFRIILFFYVHFRCSGLFQSFKLLCFIQLRISQQKTFSFIKLRFQIFKFLPILLIGEIEA